jgi:hypothetical protein
MLFFTPVSCRFSSRILQFLLVRYLKKPHALPKLFSQMAVPLSKCAMMLPTPYYDELFATLFPKDGKRALAPWRLALVTFIQFGSWVIRSPSSSCRAGSSGLEGGPWPRMRGLRL